MKELSADLKTFLKILLVILVILGSVHEWVAHVELSIKENYTKTLTLDHIAENCHGSAYHTPCF